MATQYRVRDVSEWVHVSDSEAQHPAGEWTGPTPLWLPAAGQPAGCTRFGIRVLTVDELAHARTLPADQQSGYAVGLALRTVDGKPPESMAQGWDEAIASLIFAVTVVGPFLGRRSTSAAATA